MAIWLEVPALSPRHKIVFSIGIGLGYVIVGMVVSELWGFPVPFYSNTVSVVVPLVFAVSLRVTIGPRAFRTILSRKEQWRRSSRISMLQGFMYAIYPVYEVLFGRTKNTPYELPVILLLPVLKLLMKFVFAASATYKEEIVPSQVVFTVDFYNAFYVATFLNSLSTISLVAIMGVDLLQTGLEVQEIHAKMQRVLAGLAQTNSGQISGHRGDLLEKIRNLCLSLSALESFQTANQVLSCKPHKLTPEGAALLETLERKAVVKAASRRFSDMSSCSTLGPIRMIGTLRSALINPLGQVLEPKPAIAWPQRTNSHS
ncbi:hypothetical protein PHYSODRAFT_298042 [Phytophthora sojae]|uniref:Uncharacterized protein n=1 Tax=Phytophthora sojae (strain P6497) TaxID=1094619 RepID=G4Z5T3_PHYSP|nr:hypothetical protein PHYSODRAFT_298042 [Phytophthora sojae]EGZ19516.1 hypothetical protein PHYSODRAFT_298042 [Phytophthora sojae]|eukprot:XP_009522233.1 hypothetical protein PHYSODRAFT_298042 [Phytophthora sojae]